MGRGAEQPARPAERHRLSGETVALGTLPLHGWWTEYSGYVFNDKNRNGVKDAGENGIPNFTLTLRKRDNSLMDRGQTTATTDANGFYSFEGAYPLGEFGWTVMEAYSDSFYTTGVTYQADNQPTPTTIKGAGVDVSTLNIIGLGGTFDWGVHAYDPTGANGVDPRNGGIVGSVSYDTTRNELDPQYAAAEDWQPGVPDVPVMLYATVDCDLTANPGAPCDANDNYELDADGSRKKGELLNSYLSENWERPTGCKAYDVDGIPLVHGVDEDHQSTGARRRVRPRLLSERPVRHLPNRPGHPGRELRRRGQRQLRLRRRLLQRNPRCLRPGEPGLQRRHLRAAGRGRLPRQPRDPRRPDRQPEVQGDRRGGHQHRQRQPDHPAGSAAGLRRRAAHRRRPRRNGDGQLRRIVGDGTNGAPAGCDRACIDPGRQRDRSSTSAARPTRAPRSRRATPSWSR